MESDPNYRPYLTPKQKKFRRLERVFRTVQAILLLLLIVSFMVYVVLFGIDICLYSSNLTQLFFVLVLDFLGVAFIGIGIRGVALEMLGIVIAASGAFVIVSIGHAATFTFRHLVLNSCNLALDIVLAVLFIYYSCLLCRFLKSKPHGYDRRLNKLAILQSKKIYMEQLTAAKQQQPQLERKLSYDSDSSTEQYKEKPILASVVTTLGTIDPEQKVPLVDPSSIEPTLALDENGLVGRTGTETSVKSFSNRTINKSSSKTTVVSGSANC